ncbi:hypothetical protein M2404_003368 [Rheinheimera pacifica]|uniref:hypothetical protein n=1 Tax=Rheinheimera pacifica TaxID=173990 RepID=UPI0021683CD9|nr:hypothetical protein [Rheinheimera pacifica]MCS4309005.1 hypothetical protein [Rheinheimera pacifica]
MEYFALTISIISLILSIKIWQRDNMLSLGSLKTQLLLKIIRAEGVWSMIIHDFESVRVNISVLSPSKAFVIKAQLDELNAIAQEFRSYKDHITSIREDLELSINNYRFNDIQHLDYRFSKYLERIQSSEKVAKEKLKNMTDLITSRLSSL